MDNENYCEGKNEDKFYVLLISPKLYVYRK